MSNVMRRLVSLIGIAAGIFIIYIGMTLNPYASSTDAIGESIKFGADFYTEIYSVTQDVGEAVNSVVHSINNVCICLKWLVKSIGIFDVCFFSYTLFAPKQKLADKVVKVNESEQTAAQ